jgi:thiol-disulfide isomerase/thioredoxin
MVRELTGPLQHAVGLFLELQKASPKYAQAARETICLYRAELALFGDADALTTLTDESHSAAPADALAGTVGLMIVRWWTDADVDKQKQELAEFTQLAKANPNDGIMVAALLKIARYGAASEELGNATRDVVENVLTSSQAIAYKGRPYKLGKPFNLTAKTIDGMPISTASWRGKVVILDFWATWCPPCVAAVPDLIKLYQDNHDKGLEILGISNDNDLMELRKYLADHKDMIWPQLFHPSPPDGWNDVSHEMGVASIPTTFFIDRNGILRDIEVNELRPDLIAKYMAEAADPAAAPPPPPADAPAPQAEAAPVPTSAAPATPAAPIPVATIPAAPPADAEANSLLREGKLLAANDHQDLAAEKFNTLIERYPTSPAAAEAKKLLSQIDGGQ